jgi:HD superfamily phosphohydrolase
MERKYEIRCPIHGFIELDDWEWSIINQPAFQRLRRIRQLGLTDYVYPGATHTRFEHSLGVMHVATRLYDAIVARSKNILQKELQYNEDGLKRDRRIVRLAALLHDVGHAPFSHASEELMPQKAHGSRFKHEDYTASIIRMELREAIENHKINQINYDIKAETIAQLIEGNSRLQKGLLFWQTLLISQLDADRMDYLLRDSYHIGVRYGVYDLERLLNSVCAFTVRDESGEEKLTIGVSEDGWHASESLILARYYMFTQVYYHKTRRAYDYHITRALSDALPDKSLPPPDTLRNIRKFLNFDDWWMLGMISANRAGEHGKIIKNRTHYRMVYSTPETPLPEEIERCNDLYQRLRETMSVGQVFMDTPEKSWYNPEKEEVWIWRDDAVPVLLHEYSHPVKGMQGIRQYRLYAAPEVSQQAKGIVKEV